MDTDTHPKMPPLGLVARGTIDRVVDGDTIDCMVLGVPARIRLLDCWAPETRGEEREAGEASKAYMESIAPEGTPVVVQVDTSGADRLLDLLTFGRVLGRIWLRDSEVELSAAMVHAGFATATKEG